MIAIGMKDPIINSMSPILVFITIMCSSKMITSCIIHGKVYEQTEKLLLTFDEIDVSDDSMDEKFFFDKICLKS